MLRGMERTHEWITSLEPGYLVDKYGREVKITNEGIEGFIEEDGKVKTTQIYKPVQTKWETGFVHVDPFEERVVGRDNDR